MKTLITKTTCDRCGDEYTPNIGRTIADMVWMVMTNGGGSRMSDMSKDLCHACTTGFLAWWNNARKN